MALSPSLFPAPGWPDDIQTIAIPGQPDEPEQPALFYRVPGEKPAPLLVGLHTWSSDYRQAGSSLPYLDWCRREGWHFIHPHFGGPNRTPRAMGSNAAVADVVNAVAWAQKNAPVDAGRIYLVGVSGGGHMALLMAGRHPEIWAGVSAWCGISDIAQWHANCRATPRFGRYANDIEAALGGPPDNPARQADATRRSPLTWLAAARHLPLDIQAGLHDGRAGSVPFAHSLRAYNAAVDPAAALSEEEITAFYATRQHADPAPPADALYGERQPVFQRAHGNTRITIFEGGHEILHAAALNWLAQQRRGQPAVWTIANPKPFEVNLEQTQSGK